jgi:hypothetical protein
MLTLKKLNLAIRLWFIGYSWAEAWEYARKTINWQQAEKTLDKWLK